LLFSGLLLPGDWSVPTASGWALFVLAGACSVVAWIGIIGGYRRASPAMLAPFEYTALIGGAIAGYLIWNEVPDRWVVTGAIVIIGSGLFVVYREVGHAFSNKYLRVFTAAGSAALARRRRLRRAASEE
jgi:drug/metabolite transporter (DMT)-like permease